MDFLEKELRDKAIIRSSNMLFQKSEAIEVIKRCKARNFTILGIDSFEVIQEGIKPKETLDCSINNNDDGNWALAIKFIESPINNGFVFEITYDI
ncbi:hypothetical protein [Pontibacillus sp. HMF3514]|uniref:hypothetical protein n=1 Tax=Pontibacillus sp. HMF3514 TaxID=2692425 RepID=UPI00131FFE2D|nr:hypothetical protein [Pontibacillus sp. HMF3514]QHE52773.1 hypothetical protein GS400_12375 [Pontibacillus sp. HMF3514]